MSSKNKPPNPFLAFFLFHWCHPQNFEKLFANLCSHSVLNDDFPTIKTNQKTDYWNRLMCFTFDTIGRADKQFSDDCVSEFIFPRQYYSVLWGKWICLECSTLTYYDERDTRFNHIWELEQTYEAPPRVRSNTFSELCANKWIRNVTYRRNKQKNRNCRMSSHQTLEDSFLIYLISVWTKKFSTFYPWDLDPIVPLLQT